jgi:hypothetical protein
MIDPYSIPWVGGAYRLRIAGCNTDFPGASFRNGVTTHPVTGRVAKRLHQSWGRSITIELWDEAEPAAPQEAEPPPAGKIVEPSFIEGVDDLDELSRDELYDLAVSLKLDPHHRAGPERLRRLIRDARGKDRV